MKILITGGAGFIASHIQDAYISEGHEVAVLDSLVTGNRSNLHPQTKFFKGDLCDDLEAIFQEFKPEVISHHAAQIDVRKSVADPVHDCQINGIGTLQLFEKARRHGVKKIIFASSGGAIYGEQIEFPATESHPTTPTSPYGITKLLGEKYLQFYEQAYGIETVSLRYANVYGPRQNSQGEAGVVAIFIDKLLKGEIPIINGGGLQTRDYVYVGDVVRANLLALKKGVNGVFNIGTEIETNVVELFRMISTILESKSTAKHGPAKLGEQQRSVISSQKIWKELDWKPQQVLQAGLKYTIEHFQKHTDHDQS